MEISGEMLLPFSSHRRRVPRRSALGIILEFYSCFRRHPLRAGGWSGAKFPESRKAGKDTHRHKSRHSPAEISIIFEICFEFNLNSRMFRWLKQKRNRPHRLFFVKECSMQANLRFLFKLSARIHSSLCAICLHAFVCLFISNSNPGCLHFKSRKCLPESISKLCSSWGDVSVPSCWVWSRISINLRSTLSKLSIQPSNNFFCRQIHNKCEPQPINST